MFFWVQSKNKPHFTSSLSFLCEFHFVDLDFAIMIMCLCVDAVECAATFAWMHVLTGIRGQEACELMLRLHSCFQIKAKNYDKVEKVSAKHTSETFKSDLYTLSTHRWANSLLKHAPISHDIEHTPTAESSSVDFQKALKGACVLEQ